MDIYTKAHNNDLGSENLLEPDQQKRIHEKLLAEQIKILNNNLLVSLPANLICSIIIFWGLRNTTASSFIYFWFIAVIVTTIFRFTARYFYYLQPQQNKLNLYTFIIGTILSASLWGLLTSIFMPVDNLLYQMIVIVILAGIISGGSNSLQPNLLAGFLYLLIALLPFIMWLFYQRNINYFILGIAVSTYLIFMLANLWRGYHLLEHALKLYYVNLELVKNLTFSNQKLQHAYHAIEEDKNKLRIIQDNAPIGMAIMSLRGEWLQVNNALCKILGYSKEELRKLRFQDITYSEDLPNDLIYLEQFTQGKAIHCQYDKRYVHKNGDIIWAMINASLICDVNNQPIYFILQIQDITERKKNEEIVAKLHERTKHMLLELQQREADMAIITKMNEMLQICNGSQEAYDIVSLTAQELFPNLCGSLSICQALNSNDLETVKQWGLTRYLKEHFIVNDCWSLRQGLAYSINDTKKNLIICPHFSTIPCSYLCMPLIVQSGTIGILTLSSKEQYTITDYQKQLANSFNECIRLSLANIKLRENLHDQATKDPLTGLFNRRYLNEILPQALKSIIRDHKTLCVCMFDLDNFKKFNDTYGHEIGDEILKFVSLKINESVRSNDITCRYGGEEFILVLVGADINIAIMRVQQIQKAIKTLPAYLHEQIPKQITTSVGIAEAPNHGKNAKAIINAADKALYIAKQNGKNNIKIFNT